MSKKTLNKTNLETLGAEQLAALLMEVSMGSADIKRRLRLELSHNLGPVELAQDVRKRLTTLRRSTSFVGWRKRKALIKDLTIQVSMIVEKIAPEDPNIAFDLLWQFIEIAPSVYGRVDDSKGDIGDVFRAAIDRFNEITPRVQLDPNTLADRVWTAIQDNGYGEWDGIIPLMAHALGASGLARLVANVEAYGTSPIENDGEDHEAIQFLRRLRGGDDNVAKRKARFVKWCLQEIAAAAGDTSAYIAQYSNADLTRKDIASEVAMLFLNDAKAEDALDLLLNAQDDERDIGQGAWDSSYIASLIALGRIEDVQAHRWACFMATLNLNHLRDYLKLLPAFDDVEAEDTAMKHVLDFPDFSTALKFSLNWPDLQAAAALVKTRADEIKVDFYPLLTSAAEALRSRHPLAAVLLWRSMIDDALQHDRAFRYGHAAEHLTDCTALDAELVDYETFPTHATYLQTLQIHHDQKSSFWAKTS
ncbi:hypothetical protein OAN307_c31740 [Octadecabacter antarcticus 307]|uniref:Uncharacterized protein n=1 Tax=Octadecabacter antarcticus 307 TaxID=391626 RepID=M9RFV1_9RHOB|nr:DUF6880 family protein [Octadecabacter antarcticus]AGI68705.1 hypothetical protein OAN307_c31740 [Octadecabacter antarcticus 307]